MWGEKRGVGGDVVGAKKASFTEGWVVHEDATRPTKIPRIQSDPSTASTCNLTSYLLRDEPNPNRTPILSPLCFMPLFIDGTNYPDRVIYFGKKIFFFFFHESKRTISIKLKIKEKQSFTG